MPLAESDFLDDLLTDLIKNQTEWSKVSFVFPNKRAGVFLRKKLAAQITEPIIAPEILSIEEFMEQVSGFQKATTLELLFQFYEMYLSIDKDVEKDNLATFMGWASILLQDFNEIDQNLADRDQIFNYISAIQDLNHWSLVEKPTQLIDNYLKFWNKLPEYYNQLEKKMNQTQIGYSGFIYRKACENKLEFLTANKDKKWVFAGFNALTKAEEVLFQFLLENDNAKVYWDIDQHYMKSRLHLASKFIKKHKNSWKYYTHNPFKFESNHYTKPKDISLVNTPYQTEQAQEIRQFILDKEKNNQLEETVIVLQNPNALLPLISALPPLKAGINITMGYALNLSPITHFFVSWSGIQANKEKEYYHKDIFKILSLPTTALLYQSFTASPISEVLNKMRSSNVNRISLKHVEELIPFPEFISLLFERKSDDLPLLINKGKKILTNLKTTLDKNANENSFQSTFLWKFMQTFNELNQLHLKYRFFKSISDFHYMLKELIKSEKVIFTGKPLKGLQIMGLLETRNLNFKHLVFTDVNEGVLPPNSINNSFIPMEVRLANQLPTQQDKDAISGYHFYRLLQRAKTVKLMYNSISEGLKTSEKSRFITQLEMEGIHLMSTNQRSSPLQIKQLEKRVIPKSDKTISRLNELATLGFSPSSLGSYIRNPIDFYKEKILRIQNQEFEETIAANTLGSVVHQVLESLYMPFVGKILTLSGLENQLKHVSELTQSAFKSLYPQGDLSTGKNLLIRQVAQQLIENFIRFEKAQLKQGRRIEIVALEQKAETFISISKNLPKIKLHGIIDRIDVCDGMFRTMDYKTGLVQQNQLNITNWETVTQDYKKYSKAFQVLLYAYMLKNKYDLPFETGILSLRNLNSGFLKFTFKDTESKQKKTYVDNEILISFEFQLQELLYEIFDQKLLFIQKEV